MSETYLLFFEIGLKTSLINSYPELLAGEPKRFYKKRLTNMYWYIVRQPRSLESLAISKIEEWIALQAERLLTNRNITENSLSQQIKAIHHLLVCNVPKIFYNEVVTKELTRLLANTTVLDSLKIIIRMTEALLYTQKLTSLTLHKQSLGMYQHILLFPKSHILTNLTNLEMCCSIKTGFTKFLKELPRLKRLIYYNSHCIDNVLKCLVDNCKLIEELDLACPRNASNSNVDLMVQLSNLTNVTLYDATVTKVETLLLNCKNIEHIKIVGNENNENFIVSALNNIAQSESAGKQFKLKYFNIVSCRRQVVSVSQLQSIVNMCPLIQKITVFKHRTPQDYLTPLKDLRDLRQFYINDFYFYRDKVKEVLEVVGRNLVELCLSDNDEVDLNALMCINETCPNLESLTLKFPRQTKPYGSVFDPALCTPLKKLKRLTLMGQRPIYERLLFLLTTCPNVEYISIDYEFSLTDDIMLQVLDINPLSCLKKMIIYKHQMSKSVVDKIIHNCSGLDLEIMMNEDYL